MKRAKTFRIEPPPQIVPPPPTLDSLLVQLIRQLTARVAGYTSFESDLRSISAEQKTLLKAELLARKELQPLARKKQFLPEVWKFILGEFWRAILARGQRILTPVKTEGGPRGWNSGCGLDHVRRSSDRHVWVGA